MIASAKFGMKVPKYPPYDPTKFKNTIPETYNNEFIGLFEKIQNLAPKRGFFGFFTGFGVWQLMITVSSPMRSIFSQGII